MTSALGPDELIGWELAGVAFVRDYVELHFDGPVIRCYASPAVINGELRVAFPGPGSCDALRGLIGETVNRVQLSEDHLSIGFDGGRSVAVDFRPEWEQGREALEFMPLVDGRAVPAKKLVW